MSVRTGEQERIALRFELPTTLAAGEYELSATVRFSASETQKDSFKVHLLRRSPDVNVDAKIALFDPKGEAAKLLAGMSIKYERVEPNTDLADFDLLIIGKQALTTDRPGPDLRRVRDGLKVVVFEQTARVLEERFGFRIAECGLRQVFRRVPDHPLLAHLEEDHLCNWRGRATLLPPRLEYRLRPRYGPTVRWCGIAVPRAWRCGCRGNVASVLIEKPARGDFLPLLDGGHGLQYSPLLECRDGKYMLLFCQMDVTGRTENDPAADELTHSILRYASTWKPATRRKALYVGESAGRSHLEAVGLNLDEYNRDKLRPDCVLVVGPGGGKTLAADAKAIAKWLKDGGCVLAIGLDGAEAGAFLPAKVETKKREHIATHFAAPDKDSLLAGIGPADVHNRDPRGIPLVTGGASVLGDGILAKADDANVVFCQFVPWHFDPKKQMNLKRTFRRASFLVTRLAANMGLASSTPILSRLHSPVTATEAEKRWLDGFYLDVPEEWDGPYRYFRW